jgi:hypothetical protein
MAQYKADVWLGSKSGRQTVSVAASSLPGAVEQSRPAAPDERRSRPGSRCKRCDLTALSNRCLRSRSRGTVREPSVSPPLRAPTNAPPAMEWWRPSHWARRLRRRWRRVLLIAAGSVFFTLLF